MKSKLTTLKEPEKKEITAVGLKLCVYNTVSERSGKLKIVDAAL